MPDKKKATKKVAPNVEDIKAQTPKTGEAEMPTPIVSVEQLGLNFQKVELKTDIHNIFVGTTDKVFNIKGRMFDGKENFILMIGPGQIFAISKDLFKIIGQILPK